MNLWQRSWKVKLPFIVGVADLLLALPPLLGLSEEIHSPHAITFALCNYPAFMFAPAYERVLGNCVQNLGLAESNRLFAIFCVCTMVIFSFILGFAVDFLKQCVRMICRKPN